MTRKIPIVIIAGPTAVGKTEIALRLGEKLDGEIIGCDSMQIYKDMDIGSAKPTKEEMKKLPHHLIDFLDPREEFTVAQYATLARKIISEINKKGKLPIIAGGTGLYLNAILYDMDFSIKPSDGIFNQQRKDLYKLAETKGNQALHDKLAKLSPHMAERIHPNNVKRVIRAIEAALMGEELKEFNNISELRNQTIAPITIGIKMERKELYRRINARVDKLIEAGLLEEVKNLLHSGLSEDTIAMKGIGYKEIIGYLNGEYDFDHSIELIQRNTRRFAKRQLTWFKRYDDMKWFNLSEYENLEQGFQEIDKWVENRLEYITKATNRTT